VSEWFVSLVRKVVVASAMRSLVDVPYAFVDRSIDGVGAAPAGSG
jgi:hypothetical protein